MDRDGAGPWTHSHAFGTAEQRAGERRTRWVVALTLAMMAAEIAAGTAFGSMALLADGWHMGTHAAALGVAVFAYVYARRHAADPHYSFGTGKVGALGGFASAVGLAVVALLVLWESLSRLAAPVAIRFDHAIGVAVLGLAVNLGSALLLRDRDHGHAHGAHGAEGHGHGHDPGDVGGRGHGHAHLHRDHNLRGAYLHVVADALTSVLAVVALLAGKLLGWAFMDPLMGVAGAIVIARWSFGLLRDSAAVLLDAEVAPERRAAIREAVERGGAAVSDLHVWRVGPRHLAAIVAVVADRPEAPDAYRRRLAGMADLVHVTVEVNPGGSGGREAT
ncbi:MAG TPA: CDF family Co(II)/Ni(II) efflux transporter DmeF [Anaeromyxobacteraceae bacterium]|nr:CDF family Co(II)/Ni(II) efflux transporter DmeF [Anaeromyxobacteraceae bacterium]